MNFENGLKKNLFVINVKKLPIKLIAYHLPAQFWTVYPPKMYSPTLTKVTVGPLLSHFVWKFSAFHPSTEAR